MNKTVLAITVNEITNDNRVINYTNALALHGFKTLLVCPEISNFQKTDYHFSPIFIKIFTKKLPPISIFNYLKLIVVLFLIIFLNLVILLILRISTLNQSIEILKKEHFYFIGLKNSQ
jgi:hypothetical protein